MVAPEMNIRHVDSASAPRPPKSIVDNLCRLAPLGPYADQTANRTGDTDNPIVELSNAQSGNGHAQVAEIRDELDAGGRAIPTTD